MDCEEVVSPDSKYKNLHLRKKGKARGRPKRSKRQLAHLIDPLQTTSQQPIKRKRKFAEGSQTQGPATKRRGCDSEAV